MSGRFLAAIAGDVYACIRIYLSSITWQQIVFDRWDQAYLMTRQQRGELFEFIRL